MFAVPATLRDTSLYSKVAKKERKLLFYGTLNTFSDYLASEGKGTTVATISRVRDRKPVVVIPLATLSY